MLRITTITALLYIIILFVSCKKNDTTPIQPSTQIVTDIDGNVYHIDTIGSQIWMRENLKTTHYNNGINILNVTDDFVWAALTTAAYCNYKNEVNNTPIYGNLYNWYAVNTGILCPIGWHVPTDAEWQTLINYLGGDSIAGGKLKEAGLDHWNYPNYNATNETGFTALPGGSRGMNGIFCNINSNGFWWSYSTFNLVQNSAWGTGMISHTGSSFHGVYDFQYGYSIRCIKD